MNNIVLVMFLLVLPSSLISSEYNCTEHGHYLTLNTHGFEHVNHNLVLNGNIIIKELKEALWFIEDVKFISQGFEVVASHAQYNDLTKKTFTLTIINQDKYEIE